MLDVNVPAQLEAGNKLRQDLIDHAAEWGIQSIIWNVKIWSAHKAAQGFRSYSGSNPHKDHLHIELNRWGAENFVSPGSTGGSSPSQSAAQTSTPADVQSSPRPQARPQQSTSSGSTPQQSSSSSPSQQQSSSSSPQQQSSSSSPQQQSSSSNPLGYGSSSSGGRTQTVSTSSGGGNGGGGYREPTYYQGPSYGGQQQQRPASDSSIDMPASGIPNHVGNYILPDSFAPTPADKAGSPAWTLPGNILNGPGFADSFVDRFVHADPSTRQVEPAHIDVQQLKNPVPQTGDY